ncbi:MAG: ATP-binding cassette domain-containing protein [Patescibacteria group bacterium]
MDIVTAKGLAAGYAGHSVWEHADFSVGRGEFIGVLGPNGAGKTTLFRLLLGLARPLAGELQLFGQDVRRGNPRVGYVPQRHQVESDINIEALELVRLGLAGTRLGFSLNGASERKEALRMLKLVGATELAHRTLGQLSGGELQRVFLAEALAGKPDLLLLDEPLANLDVRREQDLVRVVSKIARERQVTVLLIAHNINPLLEVLDRVLYVANGRVAMGRPEEVLTSASLTKLYGTQVEVLHDSHGRLAVLGVEDAHHHE